MNKNRHTSAIEELSASEGVFTTAQAERLGIPRNAIANACEAGRLVRVAHGAYRMAGVPASQLDDLAALWKLTDPAKMTHERWLANGTAPPLREARPHRFSASGTSTSPTVSSPRGASTPQRRGKVRHTRRTL
ncbi:MAG: type IV toxin-antitoxin system AbiEi family antitoxin domain-containing protein [Eggerthellaceae bacterium]